MAFFLLLLVGAILLGAGQLATLLLLTSDVGERVVVGLARLVRLTSRRL